MLKPYTWVRALEVATWRTQHRWMVRVLVERASWQVNKGPIEVEYGLVVGFNVEEDAAYFLNVHKSSRYEAPRCEPVTVEPGMFVCFHDAADAMEFVKTQRAELVDEAEVVAAHRAQIAAMQEEDEMLKIKGMENKAAPAPAETKAEAPPAPKPPAKTSKKKG